MASAPLYSATTTSQQTYSNSTNAGISNAPISETSPKKLSSVAMCKYGQDLVHEITHKTYDIFGHLKTIQLPLGPNLQQLNERKIRFEDLLHRSETTFQKLHFVYNSVCNMTKGLQLKPIENCIPLKYKSNPDNLPAESKQSDEEIKLIEQIQLKNAQLKELIDHMRNILWEVDLMIAAKRT